MIVYLDAQQLNTHLGSSSITEEWFKDYPNLNFRLLPDELSIEVTGDLQDLTPLQEDLSDVTSIYQDSLRRTPATFNMDLLSEDATQYFWDDEF